MISIEGGFYYELMSTSFIWQRGPNSTGPRWSTWQQSGLDGDLLATSCLSFQQKHISAEGGQCGACILSSYTRICKWGPDQLLLLLNSCSRCFWHTSVIPCGEQFVPVNASMGGASFINVYAISSSCQSLMSLLQLLLVVDSI